MRFACMFIVHILRLVAYFSNKFWWLRIKYGLFHTKKNNIFYISAFTMMFIRQVKILNIQESHITNCIQPQMCVSVGVISCYNILFGSILSAMRCAMVFFLLWKMKWLLFALNSFPFSVVVFGQILNVVFISAIERCTVHVFMLFCGLNERINVYNIHTQMVVFI